MDAVAWTMIGVIVAALFLARWWINSAKPPPTSLRCNQCPKLARKIRMLYLCLGFAGVVWAATVAWALVLAAQRPP